MGGKVFPGRSRRYQLAEYNDLTEKVLRLLKSRYPSARMEVIPAYGAKESFGDMDILWSPESWSTQSLKSLFGINSEDISKNENVISLLYQEFQIDLIYTPKSEFNYALNYFSWNDRGNLVGRIAHKFGLKHGHNGLLLPIRTKDTVVTELVVTRDPVKAEQFLDVVPGLKFNTLEEVFENVAASRYFNPSIYLFENLNHNSRVRDKKRETYNKFLKWCEGRPQKYEFNKDKSSYLPMIFSAFPSVEVEYKEEMEKMRLKQEAHEKFNGEFAMEWTGRTGKDLGVLMKAFNEHVRKNHPLSSVTTYILMTPQEEIMKLVVKLHDRLL